MLSAGICPCILTMEFMTRRGAIKAAKMHGEKAALVPNSVPSGDWLSHMDEEDRVFAPLVKEHFPLMHFIYTEDHKVFRNEIAAFGIIKSVDRMISHSRMEDWLTLQFIEMGY